MKEPRFEESANWMLPQLPFTLGLFLCLFVCLFVRKKQASQRVKVETGVQTGYRNVRSTTEWGGNCSGDSDQERMELEREWRHAMQTGEPVQCLGGAKHSSSNILKIKIMCGGWEETTSTGSHTGEGMLLIASLSPKTYTSSPRVCGGGGEVGMTALCVGEHSTWQSRTLGVTELPNLISEFHISFSWQGEGSVKSFPLSISGSQPHAVDSQTSHSQMNVLINVLCKRVGGRGGGWWCRGVVGTLEYHPNKGTMKLQEAY